MHRTLSRKGFSLVELIISAVILAVAVSGTITVLSGISRHGGQAEKRSLALAFGRMRIEQLMSKRFDDADGDPITCSFTDPMNLGPEAGETESTYDDVDDYITTAYGGSFDGELNSDPLLDVGLKTAINVEYVEASQSGYTSLTVLAVSTCYKRVTVDVIDKKTGNSVVTFRSMVTPFK